MTKHEQSPMKTTPAWDRVQIARHPERPHTLDYIRSICKDFVELKGDRLYGNDPAIIGGLASFEDQTVMVLGHQKGASTKDNINRHFGMPSAEGFRKAERLMQHAEKFGFPILTFVDTPGANPNIHAEELGVGQAISSSIKTMLTARTPIIATIIGEGGSGGALGIAAADRVLMLENAIYTVASPEAAAAILWHTAGQAPQAAEAMHITAEDLYDLKIIDQIIKEPPGGAHLHKLGAIQSAKTTISEQLQYLRSEYYNPRKREWKPTLVQDRLQKYLGMGVFLDNATLSSPESTPVIESVPDADTASMREEI